MYKDDSCLTCKMKTCSTEAAKSIVFSCGHETSLKMMRLDDSTVFTENPQRLLSKDNTKHF